MGEKVFRSRVSTSLSPCGILLIGVPTISQYFSWLSFFQLSVDFQKFTLNICNFSCLGKEQRHLPLMTRLPLTTSPSSPLNFPRCSSASRLSSNNKYKKFTSTDIDWSARQRACCHLSASKSTRPTERPQRGAYSQRLDFQLEKWRQTLSRSTARLLSSDYNYQQQASLAPQAQTSNQNFAHLDKLEQDSGWSTLAPPTPDDDWPSDQSLVNSLISKFNRIVFGFNRAKTKCSLNRVQVETLVKY